MSVHSSVQGMGPQCCCLMAAGRNDLQSRHSIWNRLREAENRPCVPATEVHVTRLFRMSLSCVVRASHDQAAWRQPGAVAGLLGLVPRHDHFLWSVEGHLPDTLSCVRGLRVDSLNGQNCMIIPSQPAKLARMLPQPQWCCSTNCWLEPLTVPRRRTPKRQH